MLKGRYDKNSSQPGIEPGSKAPEAFMLPLHHWDSSTTFTIFSISLIQILFFINIICDIDNHNFMDSTTKKYIVAAGAIGISYFLFNYFSEDKHKPISLDLTIRITR